MKFGPDLYHLNTFHIQKRDGVNKWVGGRCNQKATRNCHEMKRILIFAYHLKPTQNAKEKGIFYCHP